MTVDEALEALSITDHDALMIAFEEERSMYFTYTEGRFVGVNVSECDGMVIKQHAGLFSEGVLCTN